MQAQFWHPALAKQTNNQQIPMAEYPQGSMPICMCMQQVVIGSASVSAALFCC